MSVSRRVKLIKQLAREFSISKDCVTQVIEAQMVKRGWPGHGYTRDNLYWAVSDALENAGFRQGAKSKAPEVSHELKQIIQRTSANVNLDDVALTDLAIRICHEKGIDPKEEKPWPWTLVAAVTTELHKLGRELVFLNDQPFTKPIERVIQLLCTQTNHHYQDVVLAVKSICDSWQISMKNDILSPGTEQRLHNQAFAFLQTLVVNPPRKDSDDPVDLNGEEPDYKWMWGELETHIESLMHTLDRGYEPTRKATFSRFAKMRTAIKNIKVNALSSARTREERERFKKKVGDLVRGKSVDHLYGIRQNDPRSCYVIYGTSGDNFDIPFDEATAIVKEIIRDWSKEVILMEEIK